MKPQHFLGSVALAACALLASGSAFAQSASVDFTTLPNAPTGPVTLGNGVDVSVAGVGHWENISSQGFNYQHYTFVQGNTQTWTFSEPVDVSFTVLGLNCPGEGIQFSGTTVTGDTINAVHDWDDAGQTVSHGNTNVAADGPQTSAFSASNTTSLTLTAVGAGTGCRRGLGSMTVTPVAVTPPTGTVAPVPIDNPLALATAGLLLGGLAGAALRRRRTERN